MGRSHPGLCLKLICDRERAIRAFVPEEYWTVTAQLGGSKAPEFPALLATIDSGVRFHADTGFVRITGPGIVAVQDTVFAVADRRVRFLPGDTLVVLDYRGEGYWNLWQRGRVFENVEGFWGAEIDDPRGAYYGDYRKEWWVHARRPDGSGGCRVRNEKLLPVSGSNSADSIDDEALNTVLTGSRPSPPRSIVPASS